MGEGVHLERKADPASRGHFGIRQPGLTATERQPALQSRHSPHIMARLHAVIILAQVAGVPLRPLCNAVL